jgi:hypothetical protein
MVNNVSCIKITKNNIDYHWTKFFDFPFVRLFGVRSSVILLLPLLISCYQIFATLSAHGLLLLWHFRCLHMGKIDVITYKYVIIRYKPTNANGLTLDWQMCIYSKIRINANRNCNQNAFQIWFCRFVWTG